MCRDVVRARGSFVALVIGRKTFETVLTFATWPYGQKPVLVLSARRLAPTPPGAAVERMSGAPADIVSQFVCASCGTRAEPERNRE